MPMVASITNSDHNLPRIPKIRDIIVANRKPITCWSLEDLELAPDLFLPEHLLVRVTELTIPQAKGDCAFVEGATKEEQIGELAERIAAIARSI